MVLQQDYFNALADAIGPLLQPGECYTCTFDGESTDFVRFNAGRVRQAGSVEQQVLGLDLIDGKRHAAGTIDLTGALDVDRQRVGGLIDELRDLRQALPPDPYLLYATEVQSTEQVFDVPLPDSGAVIGDVLDAAQGLDLVGIWASGHVVRGFANALGQRNWYARPSFNLDWSLFHKADRAVKCRFAGLRWAPQDLRDKMAQGERDLAAMTRRAVDLSPGRYRVYLASAALKEILDTVSWGGFGLKNHRTRQTSLIKMVQDGVRLDPRITLQEDHAGGLAPGFTASGFIKPSQVTLIENGVYRDCLVGPRSSREYGEPVNAGAEGPESLSMAGGALPHSEVLAALGEGLYINDLWYLNYSDRNDCRITGMTRYACFEVRGGAIHAPIPVMRFDDSLYHILGGGLDALTREREFIADAETYEQRSTASTRVPGIIVDGFALTL